MKFIQICVFFAGLVAMATANIRISSPKNLDIDSSSDRMIEAVKKEGYEIEKIEITTEDKYILTTFRIPPAQHCVNQTVKKPVFITHGLTSSSYDFIAEGPRKSLAYMLSNQCHDVWLKNSRGNSVSRDHVTLSTSDPRFWDFSWHEMGKYDIPAVIDYILNTTNETSLHFIGHSQGTTEFFVFASLRPEYHSKVVEMHALAPAIFLDKLSNPIFRIGMAFAEPLEILMRSLEIYDLYFAVKVINNLGVTFCKDEYPVLLDICTFLYSLLAGSDEPQTNTTQFINYLAHYPSSLALKQLYHFGQVLKSNTFKQYDYGIYKNLELYDSMFPPEYNISSINIPIIIYYSINDNIVPMNNIERIIKLLPNVTDVYEVPFSKFNHLDFVTAIDAKILLYDKIIELMKKFD